MDRNSTLCKVDRKGRENERMILRKAAPGDEDRLARRGISEMVPMGCSEPEIKKVRGKMGEIVSRFQIGND